MTSRRSEPCEFQKHCDGKGTIQLYVVAFDLYCCIKCAAKEEGMTQKAVREDLAAGHPGIRRARRRPVEEDE